MSAARSRDELEALLWQRIRPWQTGESGRREARNLVEDILAAADTYAADRVAELTASQLRGRLRLAEAADEAYPGARRSA